MGSFQLNCFKKYMQSHSNMLKMQLPLYNSKVRAAEAEDEAGPSLHFDYLNFMKPADAHNLQIRLNQHLDHVDEQNRLRLEATESPKKIGKKSRSARRLKASQKENISTLNNEETKHFSRNSAQTSNGQSQVHSSKVSKSAVMSPKATQMSQEMQQQEKINQIIFLKNLHQSGKDVIMSEKQRVALRIHDSVQHAIKMDLTTIDEEIQAVKK